VPDETPEFFQTEGCSLWELLNSGGTSRKLRPRGTSADCLKNGSAIFFPKGQLRDVGLRKKGKFLIAPKSKTLPETALKVQGGLDAKEPLFLY